MRRAALTVISVLLLTGCSRGPAVTGACDVPALTDEIHHIIMDSGLDVSAVEEAVCEGDWAFVRATLTGEQEPTSSDVFLLVRDQGEWLMKAPEVACEESTMPSTVRNVACVAADQ